MAMPVKNKEALANPEALEALRQSAGVEIVSLAANPLLAAVAVPPIAEAQGWIEGRSFPADKPLIDVCQAVPGYAPPDALIAHMAEALKSPATHRYTDIERSRRICAPLWLRISAASMARPTVRW